MFLKEINVLNKNKNKRDKYLLTLYIKRYDS